MVARDECDVTFTTFLCRRIAPNFGVSDHSMILVDDKNETLFVNPDPVKVKIENGLITRVNKHLNLADTNGVNPGFYHYSAKDIQTIFVDIYKHVESGDDDQSLYLSLDRVAHKMKIQPRFCKNVAWVDVDSSEDLARLKSHFTDNDKAFSLMKNIIVIIPARMGSPFSRKAVIPH